MARFLIDTNIISHYFAGSFSKAAMDFIAREIDKGIHASIITKIEALSWVNTDKAKEDLVRQFINDIMIVGLTDNVVDRCISLRRGRSVKIPDAIIAATALVHDLTLITLDKVFDRIENIKVLKPSAM